MTTVSNTVDDTAFECTIWNMIKMKIETISFQKSLNVLVKSVCLLRKWISVGVNSSVAICLKKGTIKHFNSEYEFYCCFICCYCC